MVGQRVRLQKTGLQGVVGDVLWDVVHNVHDLVQNLLRKGSQQEIKTAPLRTKLNLLSAKANQATGLAAQKGGKVTVFSFCKALPCPNKDHWCRKTKTAAAKTTAAKTTAMTAIQAMERRSTYSITTC
jgi:hypothetical protein